ncbi:Ubiquitin carboxyl-terminal hydrolase bap1 [Dermatophagoides farinae]|uniref:ubiquitinyl hydrolase 1 n=1 Tax=Dermatophagoides farinae TaxID=6954 RepID=A0A922I3B2_DERFA|nr:Ubiquitin carboxyl-terminal hydrolase bap1 [Dermatophagoides farinae]
MIDSTMSTFNEAIINNDDDGGGVVESKLQSSSLSTTMKMAVTNNHNNNNNQQQQTMNLNENPGISKLNQLAENWLELESDPGLFTLLIRDFGCLGVEVEEIYDLQSSFDNMDHVYGFIFLFNVIEERRNRCSRGNSIIMPSMASTTTIQSISHLTTTAAATTTTTTTSTTMTTTKVMNGLNYQSPSCLLSGDFIDDPKFQSEMFFAHQKVPNSCATHAILSVLLNCSQQIDIGPILRYLKDYTMDMTPEDKGLAISNIAELAKAHNSHATHLYLNNEREQHHNHTTMNTIRISQRTNTNSTMEAFHFVSFVPINGHLIELDGLKERPIDHGRIDPLTESWTEKFRRLVRQRIETSAGSVVAGDIRYNLMAVIPNRYQCRQRLLNTMEFNRLSLFKTIHLMEYHRTIQMRYEHNYYSNFDYQNSIDTVNGIPPNSTTTTTFLPENPLKSQIKLTTDSLKFIVNDDDGVGGDGDGSGGSTTTDTASEASSSYNTHHNDYDDDNNNKSKECTKFSSKIIVSIDMTTTTEQPKEEDSTKNESESEYETIDNDNDDQKWKNLRRKNLKRKFRLKTRKKKRKKSKDHHKEEIQLIDSIIKEIGLNSKQPLSSSLPNNNLKATDELNSKQSTTILQDINRLMYTLNHQILRCQHECVEEKNILERYAMDVHRRTHDYDDLIQTFLSMLSDQGLLDNLFDHHNNNSNDVWSDSNPDNNHSSSISTDLAPSPSTPTPTPPLQRSSLPFESDSIRNSENHATANHNCQNNNNDNTIDTLSIMDNYLDHYSQNQCVVYDDGSVCAPYDVELQQQRQQSRTNDTIEPFIDMNGSIVGNSIIISSIINDNDDNIGDDEIENDDDNEDDDDDDNNDDDDGDDIDGDSNDGDYYDDDDIIDDDDDEFHEDNNINIIDNDGDDDDNVTETIVQQYQLINGIFPNDFYYMDMLNNHHDNNNDYSFVAIVQNASNCGDDNNNNNDDDLMEFENSSSVI